MKKKSSGLRGVESDPTSEVNYISIFQCIDMDVKKGRYCYQVKLKNIMNGIQPAVVGRFPSSG